MKNGRFSITCPHCGEETTKVLDSTPVVEEPELEDVIRSLEEQRDRSKFFPCDPERKHCVAPFTAFLCADDKTAEKARTLIRSKVRGRWSQIEVFQPRDASDQRARIDHFAVLFFLGKPEPLDEALLQRARHLQPWEQPRRDCEGQLDIIRKYLLQLFDDDNKLPPIDDVVTDMIHLWGLAHAGLWREFGEAPKDAIRFRQLTATTKAPKNLTLKIVGAHDQYIERRKGSSDEEPHLHQQLSRELSRPWNVSGSKNAGHELFARLMHNRDLAIERGGSEEREWWCVFVATRTKCPGFARRHMMDTAEMICSHLRHIALLQKKTIQAQLLSHDIARSLPGFIVRLLACMAGRRHRKGVPVENFKRLWERSWSIPDGRGKHTFRQWHTSLCLPDWGTSFSPMQAYVHGTMALLCGALRETVQSVGAEDPTSLGFCKWLLEDKATQRYGILLGEHCFALDDMANAQKGTANDKEERERFNRSQIALQRLTRAATGHLQADGGDGENGWCYLDDNYCTLRILMRLFEESALTQSSAFGVWAVAVLGGARDAWDPLEFVAPAVDLPDGYIPRFPRDPRRCKIEAIARIGYDQLRLDRRLRVGKHLNEAIETEAMLHVSKRGYRDHLDHVLAVWVTGDLLLHAQRAGERNALGDVLGLPLATGGLRKPLTQWYVAALYHDLGYIIEVYPELLRQTGIVNSSHVDNLIRQLRDAKSRVLSELNADARLSEALRVEHGDREDHGIVSYAHLRNLLRDVDQQSGMLAGDKHSAVLLEELYVPALRAVLLHSLFAERIDVRRDPLAALLVISDEIQEWGRCRLPTGTVARRVLEVMNQRAVTTPEQWMYTKGVKIGNRNPDTQDGTLTVSADEPIHVVIEYMDQNRNVYNPLDVLLYKIANLQRLCNGPSLNIKIDLCFRKLRGKTDFVSELDILQAYVEQEDAGWIDREVYCRHPASDGAVSSGRITYRESKDCETLTIDLALLAADDRLLVSRMPWAFQEELLHFKREYVMRHEMPCRFFYE